jgi:hypothetical protein
MPESSLKLRFDRFTMGKMSNFNFNRILMSFRTRPKTHCVVSIEVFYDLKDPYSCRREALV